MFTAKKRQKSVLELYLGNRFLMVSCSQPGVKDAQHCDVVPNNALGTNVCICNRIGLPAGQSYHLLTWQQHTGSIRHHDCPHPSLHSLEPCLG